MIDLRQVIAPNSDQLNADDLIGCSKVIRVTSVELRKGDDQPVTIHFDGDGGKPWRPCKSMSRVLVHLWGPDAKTYAGRKIKIYRDDKVLFGKVAVGGVRISHVSDIDKPVTMALTVTRGVKRPYTVQPLQSEPESPLASDIERKANAAALKGIEELRTYWDGLDAPQKRALQPRLQKLKEIAAKNDFASEPDARAPLGGGKRAQVCPDRSLDAPAHPESLAGAQASGAAEEARPIPSPKSPDATPFTYEAGEEDDPPGALEAAYHRGRADRRSGKSDRTLPQEYRTQECNAEAAEWRTGWNDEDCERKAA